MSGFPASSILLAAIFGAFALLTVTGALIAALSARLIRGVCGLALCSVGLAGLYYFLHSPFLALMEILVYIGAVCVTIVFAIMLAEPEEGPRAPGSRRPLWWGGGALLVSSTILATLGWLALHANWVAPTARVNDGSVRAIGVAFLSTYSLAFELVSVVLLVAILGALAIAGSGRTKA